MTPITSKLIAGSCFALTLSILAPSQAKAVANSDEIQKPNRAVQNNINFCTLFTNSQARLMEQLADRETKLVNFRKARVEKTTERRIDQDAKLDNIRDEAEKNRSRQIELLNGKAETQEQKSAVSAYQTTIQTAIAKRRTDIDLAIKNFRQGVNTAVLAHKTAIDASVTVLKTATKNATEKAKTDCASGKDPKIVKQEFQASMETARKAFKTARDSAPKIDAQLKTLTETRKQAVDKAIEEFKTTAEKARQDLKTAFGK